MKIGILTLPQETNYGGILQAFALQYKLKSLGHEAIVIDRHKRHQYSSLGTHLMGYTKRLIEFFFLRKNVSIKWNPFQSEVDFKISLSEVRVFIDRNMKMTRYIYSDQLKEIDNEYLFDAYIVGSDQVWLDYYCPNSFLDFVEREGVLKITYAASCSLPKSFFQNKSKTRACALLAKKFNGISVREKKLVDKCEKYLGITPLWLIDPTMLLNKEDYLNIAMIKEKEMSSIFTYILDENKNKSLIVEDVKKRFRLPTVKGNSKKVVKGVLVPESVEKWLYHLNSSSFVVTDSFHGTVFSIIFNKPFVSIVNKYRGEDRFVSLLEMFGLSDRLIYDHECYKLKDLVEKPIDFDKVNAILNKEKEKAVAFLENCLKQKAIGI